VQRWNEVAGFRKCLRLTGRRLRWFQSRVRDRFWCEHWLEALERASRLPFCLGQNDRSWRADVVWFLRELTVLRLIEGGYLENAGTRPARPAELPEQRAARLAAEREARERAAREALPSVQAKELLSKVLRKKMVSSEGVQKP
jgi:hypothetical protein